MGVEVSGLCYTGDGHWLQGNFWGCSDNTLQLQGPCGQSRDEGKTRGGNYSVDYGFSIWREYKEN